MANQAEQAMKAQVSANRSLRDHIADSQFRAATAGADETAKKLAERRMAEAQLSKGDVGPTYNGRAIGKSEEMLQDNLHAAQRAEHYAQMAGNENLVQRR